MKRYWAIALITCFLAGCRAPTPSMNFLAPYGSATVPAPPTGSVGTSNDYYAPPQPSSTTGGAPAGAASGDQSNNLRQLGPPPGNFVGASDPGDSPTDNSVVRASYDSAGHRSDDSSEPLNWNGSGTTSASSNLKLQGMPVNDATSAVRAQDSALADPINLSHLPDARYAPSGLRILTPGTTRAGVRRGVPTPATPPDASGVRGSWQGR